MLPELSGLKSGTGISAVAHRIGPVDSSAPEATFAAILAILQHKGATPVSLAKAPVSSPEASLAADDEVLTDAPPDEATDVDDMVNLQALPMLHVLWPELAPPPASGVVSQSPFAPAQRDDPSVVPETPVMQPVVGAAWPVLTDLHAAAADMTNPAQFRPLVLLDAKTAPLERSPILGFAADATELSDWPLRGVAPVATETGIAPPQSLPADDVLISVHDKPPDVSKQGRSHADGAPMIIEAAAMGVVPADAGLGAYVPDGPAIPDDAADNSAPKMAAADADSLLAPTVQTAPARIDKIEQGLATLLARATQPLADMSVPQGLEIDLGSEHYGKLVMQVRMVDGTLFVHLATTNPAAELLLRRTLPTLARDLEARGLSAVRVSLGQDQISLSPALQVRAMSLHVAPHVSANPRLDRRL